MIFLPLFGSLKGIPVPGDRDGKTGFIVNPDEGIEGLKSAVEKLSTINPSDCRTHVEQNFSLPVMAQNYENVYKEVIEQHKNC